MNTDKIYVDMAYKSLNKYTEELCGDRVESVRNENCYIAVLSDGLGSGVKANILATLTSKIISTMMKEGASIEDTVETVVHTLPVCSVRKVAYSTFSILRIDYTGNVYLAEFDSPSCIFIRKNKIMPIKYNEKIIAGKTIREARFKVCVNDLLTLISDGVIYAGIGATLNLGWNWQNASAFTAKNYDISLTPARMVNIIAKKCNELYIDKPGDDTTIAAIKIIPQMEVSLFSGPPKNPADDKRLMADFMSPAGKKIVCGGSSSTIASRILGEEIEASLDYLDPEIPPIGRIKGVDLVTEGVITLKRTVSIITNYFENKEKFDFSLLDAGHGAAKIAKILIEECTHLHMFIGRQINPAHVTNDTFYELSTKQLVLDQLSDVLTKMGKVVTKQYY